MHDEGMRGGKKKEAEISASSARNTILLGEGAFLLTDGEFISPPRTVDKLLHAISVTPNSMAR
jgi:hypothetical protein